jgi:predicted deacylase
MRWAHKRGKSTGLHRAGTLSVQALALLWVSAAAVGQVDEPPPSDEPLNSQEYVDLVSESVAITSAPGVDEVLMGPPKPERTETKRAEKLTKQPRIAENVDLSEPVVLVPEFDDFGVGTIAPPEEPEVRKYSQPPLLLLDSEVGPSTAARLSWTPGDGFESIAVPTPVLVVNGAQEGPTLCITAAVHGDELNGIEVVRRVLYELDSEKLNGAVIGVPIVNLQGFRRASRYLPDRRDLNRYFPGNTGGSSASRIAHSFFTEVIEHCDALVDVHTGSFHRTNLPQLRADLENPGIRELTGFFGTTVVLHSSGASGTLRRAASDAGIPSVTLEAGEPVRVQEEAIAFGTRGILTLMNKLGMVDKSIRWRGEQPVYRRSKWQRADHGGVLFSEVELGEEVEKGELLGTITDPITNVQTQILASHNGRILGMALPQFVMPGFAAYRIGIAGGASIDISDPNAPSDSDDLIDVENEAETLGAVDEFDGEDDESYDYRDSAEDSE